MQYEAHAQMRISISSWSPRVKPAKTPTGVYEEEDPKVLHLDSKNAREVAQAIRNFVESKHGLNLSMFGADPRSATSFELKYDPVRWTSTSARNELLSAILPINQRPRRTRGVRPTAYPAGFTRV